jgi:hypothetical protein
VIRGIFGGRVAAAEDAGLSFDGDTIIEEVCGLSAPGCEDPAQSATCSKLGPDVAQRLHT